MAKKNLQLVDAVDDNYKLVRDADGTDTSLEVANDKLRVNGDLDVSGYHHNVKLPAEATVVADGNVTLKSAGDINLQAEGVDINFIVAGTTYLNWHAVYGLTLKDVTDTDDYFRFLVGGNGASIISTNDDAGESATLTLDIDGNIYLDADRGNIYLKDDDNYIATFHSSDSATHSDNTFKLLSDADADDFFSIVVTDAGATTIATIEDAASAAHLTLDVDGKITLDSATGEFEMKGAGATAKFADMYAGMILGYTDIGLDETHATYDLTTDLVVPTDEFGVTFVAPPSGNVEIFVQIKFYAGTTGQGDLVAGLSTANATSGYSAVEDFHEELLTDQSGRHGMDTVHTIWTLTGLTAGTSYTRWLGVKSTSTGGTPQIQWGGNSSGRHPDFIMKATALPATITT